MRTARATVGPLLLAGFYALAAGVVGGVIILNLLILRGTGRLFGTVAFASAFVIFALLRSVFFVARLSDEPAEDEVDVPRTAEPRLWALVDDTAAAMGTRAPDELRLVHDVNASVSEDSRLLGLLTGRRVLRVGVALLQVLDVDELKAVLAHEMGHYAGGDTRLGGVAYRGGESIHRAVQHLGPTSLPGRLFAAYATLYHHATLAVRRRQELTADAAAVRIAGAGAHASALRKVAGAAAAYGFYLDHYAAPVWNASYLPADLYGGFRQLISDPCRQAEIVEAIEARLDAMPGPFDTHPTLAQRLLALGPSPEPAAPQAPARSLMTDAGAAEAAVAAALGQSVTGRSDLPALSWDEVAPKAYAGASERHATQVLTLVGALDGKSEPASLQRLLDWLDSPAIGTLAVQLAGDLSDVPDDRHADVRAESVIWGTTAAVSCALAAQGLARWEVSWSGPALLREAGGATIDVEDIVRRTLDDDDVPQLAAVLRGRRLRLDWVPEAAHAPERHTGELRGVLLNVVYRRHRHDVVLYDDGAALVRTEMGLGDRIATLLATSSGGLFAGPAIRRLPFLEATPREALLAATPGNRFVPWGTVAAGRLRRRLSGWRLDLDLDARERVTVTATTLSPSQGAVRGVMGDLLGDRLAGR